MAGLPAYRLAPDILAADTQNTLLHYLTEDHIASTWDEAFWTLWAMNDLDDDYIAKLLAEDAKKTSQRYATQGLPALIPRKRAADAPKPNTRFLSHLVREADTHNASLKRKEELEAERRLRALRDPTNETPRKRRRADESDESKRSRMLRDVLGAAQSQRSRPTQSDHRPRTALPVIDQSRTRDELRVDRSRPKPRSESTSPAPQVRRERASKNHHRRHNSSDVSSDSERDSSRAKANLRRKNSESSHRSRTRPVTDPKDRDISDTESNDLLSVASSKAVKIRGRGAHRERPGIDSRFADDYDPSLDVSLESDNNSGDDWDLALEAMRDRAKYRKSQAARMREAGFTEAEVLKWEKGPLRTDDDDRRPDLVKWSRKGDAREWDIGKTFEQ